MAKIYLLGTRTPTPTPTRFGSSHVMEKGIGDVKRICYGELVFGEELMTLALGRK